MPRCLAQNISVTSMLLKKVLPATFFGILITCLPGTRVAQAQTLKADFRFQNTRASAVGSSSLTDTGSNTFQADLVDGVTRTVLRFPFNNGLRLSAATGQIPANSYTIVMLFKVDSVSGFVRLVDFKNRTSDNGLYINNGHLESCTSCTNFAANTYVQVAYTRTSGGTFAGYVNGVLQGQGPDAGNDLVIDGSNILNFFQDDLAAGNEASAGSVARIRLYDAPMTGAQIAALDREPAGATTFSVTNTNDTGLGSLRQAMLDSNANPGPDTISFNIPGSGVRTINPLSELPTLSSPVIIDGYSQPGASTNTLATGSDAVLLIELNGTNAGGTPAGVRITTSNCTIRGLVINRFDTGIEIVGSGASNNLIEGNRLGTNAAGTTASPNTVFGVIINSASGNTIGGTSPAARNIVSGNANTGVSIQQNGASANVVRGNYIGTNAAGTASLGVQCSGVFIVKASNNIIGGTTAGSRNIISGNGCHGIHIGLNGSFPSIGNLVQGNFIGTNAAGTGAVGNFNAVELTHVESNNNFVGGTVAGAGNLIAFNTGYGVSIDAASGSAVLSNSIFSNGNLGIRLAANGNGNQAAPVLTAVQSFGGNTTIRGTLASTPNKTFTIQFFLNNACDPSGAGEGQTLIGSTTTATDSVGNASFTISLAIVVSPTQVITATATDPTNNTSAFSLCRSVSFFTITGHIADVGGNNLGGVTVNLNGTVNTQTTTDGSGNYSFNALPGGGSFTVTATGTGLSFSPVNFNFNDLDSNRIANFVGTQTLVSISGKVVDGNDVAMNNVSVSLTKNGSAEGTVQTNALGNYSFANLEAGANYVVTPAGSFTPSSQSLSNLTANATANFKAAPGIPPQCNTATFAAAANVATGTGPRFITIADFNSDGKSDLAVANQGSDNVSILLGTGAGSFGAATNFAVGAVPRPAVVGDFNSDGKADLAVANGNSNNISILLGSGTGSFSAATNFLAGTQPVSLAISDFNGDGKSDLAVVNLTSQNVSILLGSGTGSFSAATNFPVGADPFFVASGDFNGDGKSDLAVANPGSDNVSILLGSGTGSFSAPTNFPAGLDPFSLVIGDFNGDSKSDLAVANQLSDNVSILLGSGTGSFSAATNFAVGTFPFAIAIGDFNGDGKSDLSTANLNSNNFSILLGSGTGSFGTATNFAVGTNPAAAAVGDFNGDGKSDLAIANRGANNVSIQLNSSATCNTQTSLSISGHMTAANNIPLSDVTVTLSGPITRVTQTDVNGNYLFASLVPGGNYSVTLQNSYFVFAPSRADFFNLASSQVANFIAAPLAVPSPTPTPNDDFGGTTRDASRWTLGTQTSPPGSFDPQVTTAQVNGQLVITPLTQAAGMHYDGYVSANAFDMRNGSASVELVKAASGGADTIFAVGSDTDNFYRFMVHTAGGPSSPVTMLRYVDGSVRPLDTTVSQLIFQVNINGQLTSLSINYDPQLHRFMRFRHVPPPTNSIVFETSPDNVDFTVQHTVVLQKSVSALTAELSAGTSNPTNPGQTVFDNFGLVTSTFQFSAGSYSVGEGDGSILVTVTRSGSLTDAATVDFATSDGTARQKTKYTSAAGTLSFASGIASRTFRVLLIDNQLAEGDQTLNLLLSNPTGSGLNSPGRAFLNILDNDSTVATTNSLDDARYFVTQHYYDFLSRVPDQSGLDFWVSQITQCGTDQACLRTQRITVSNAFFYEQEYQQTGSYVVRVYRAAYGNNQPISNNDANPQFPNENKKLVNYSAFSPDRARVRGGPSLAQTQLDLANAFVLRPEFLARYPASLDGPAFVDAMLATINNDIGLNLSSQRTALIDLFNQGGRGKVLYRLADDNATNPIANQAFLDAEYNRSFVLTQYFGYLRRNPDVGGFVFWLGQVNSAPLRSLDKQRAMVCSFITSQEYQQRFSPVATHNNTECQ